MRGKAARVRLSPNEEAQLVREEQERRRKLRLQQVREQERSIARQVRRQVQERRQQQMQTLADALHQDWQQQHTLRLETLHTHLELSHRAVGQAHRSAHDHEPDADAVCRERAEQQQRAELRHQEALREMNTRRHTQEQQQRRHVEARRRALEEEKRRAQRVCALPPPPPDPLENILMKAPRPKPAEAERFSITHCHMTPAAVDRETHTETQASAQEAAALELRRLEDLQRDEGRDEQERVERAQQRGRDALRREQNTQERARLLCELERLQQADRLRRRQALGSVPPQVFQPLYRQEELRDQQQRELEIAFLDAYTQERRVKGDLVLQLVPEPLPPPSSASLDEELDVTLDPECAAEAEEPDSEPASAVEEPHSLREPVSSASDTGRRALSRLLERIRSQRERRRPPSPPEGDTEALSVDTGAPSSQETSGTHTQDDAPEVSDEAVVCGTLLPSQEPVQPTPAHTDTHVEALLGQQEEQLALLEELEEQRRELEQRLTQGAPQDTDQRTQETSPAQPHTQDGAADAPSLRLRQHQQRLVEQTRLHQRCVAEARRRLQEYQRTLKLRDALTQRPSGAQERSAPPLVPSTDPAAPALQCPALPRQPQTLQSRSLPPESEHTPVLSGASLQDVDRQEAGPALPLPPPAVLLELLRRQQRPLLETERHARGQRDALISADAQGPALSSAVQTDDRRATPDTVCDVMEEEDDRVKPPSAPLLQDTHTLSNGVSDAAPVHRGRVKPPVSRPPARLPFFQQMEPHELSAIQEVDTPVNASLDAESSSASLPIVSDAHSPSGRSEVTSGRSEVTGRTGRMSWREALLQDSSVSSAQQQEEELEMCPSAGEDPARLCSSSVSTGLFSVSAADASLLCSSLESSPARSPAQQIIHRYSQQLHASLTHAGAVGSPLSWSSVLHEEDHQSSSDVSGVFQPLQPQLDSSSSSSSGGAVRANQSSGAQGWSGAVSRILERVSGQLSVPRASAAPQRDTHAWAELQTHSSSAVCPRVSGAPHVQPSQVMEESTDVFLPLPCELTHGSSALCVPLEAAEESADLSHDALRCEAELSLTHESLSQSHTLLEESHMTRSSQEVMSSPAQEHTLAQLLVRAQAAGDVKGVLEESMLSFISLPESDAGVEPQEVTSQPQEVSSQCSQGGTLSQSEQPEELSQSEELCQSEQLEPPLPHEAQCSAAQRQRRDGLAQRSALRAAQVRDKHTQRSSEHTPLSHTADALKSVCEVRICGSGEAEMLRRTHRLCSQKEELRIPKDNRERDRHFHRKTLEKLRAGVQR